MSKDYYEILGVAKGSSPEEIKNSYKRLAKEHHPDVAKDKVAAEARFKEINEAYQVLGDVEKKKRYDQFGHAGVGGGGQGPFGSGGFSGNQWGPFTWSYGNQGDSSNFDFGEFSDPFDIFEQVFGFRGFGGSRKPRKGKSLYYSLNISFADSVKGVEKKVSIEGRELVIKIPAGISDGQELRFEGYGEKGSEGTPRGDLFITIRVPEHATLNRRGGDIISVCEISFVQAVLGDTIEIESVDATSSTGVSLLKFKIPSGTQPNTQFRLKGKGFPKLGGYGRGDHFVRVSVIIPSKLSREQKKILEEYRELR